MASIDSVQLAEELVTVAAPEDLVAFLRAHNVDIERWGKAGAKTVDDFFTELANGEARLVKDHRGAVRQIMPSGAWVYHCPEDGTALYLREAFVEDIKTGEKKDRKRSYSIGEKAKPGENHRAAIVRGVREELGIIGNFAVLDADSKERDEESPSFPGLVTSYREKKFNVILNAKQFKPEGYVEEGKKKRIHFVWQPAATAEDQA